MMLKDAETQFEPQDAQVATRPNQNFRKKLRWMVESPPDTAVRLQVTPVMAKIMLERNTFNRPLTKSRVQKYAREIRAGLWKWTGEPIIFALGGELLDGQHRLAAVVQSGVEIDVSVAFGVPAESFDKINIGYKRTAGDVFAIRGEKHYSALASAARSVWRYENTGMMSQPQVEPESAELWQYMNDKHAALRGFTSKIGLFGEAGWGCPATFVALNYLCWLKSHQAAEDFFYQLATGNEIGSRAKKHPVNRVRAMLQADIKERLLGRGMSPLIKAAYTVKAWNAFRAGKELGVIRWRGAQNPNEPFPRIK